MKKKVLLIDDSMTIHRVIDLSVDEEKYEVEKVFTAEDAENKLRTFSPDIVLLDNKLEGIKLDEFVSKIKSEIGASVVLLVGAFDHFSEGNLSATNADDFIVKPFNSSLLDEKLGKFSMVSTDQIQEVPAEKEAEKDEAVEELLASIDTDEKDSEENKFEDFNDILGDEEISKSEEDVISETESDEKIPEERIDFPEESEADEKLDLDLEEAFSEIEEKPEESLQESEELNIEEDDFEDIFETAVDDKKGFEQDFENEKKIEETELSEDILTDIVEESDEDLKDTEEIKPEESEIDAEDIFGELEEVSEESDIDKLLMDEEGLAAEKVESFEEVASEVDGTDVAQEITVDEVESDEIKEELLKEDEIEEQPDVVSEEVSEADSSTVPEGLDREAVKAVIEEAIDLDFIRDTVREVLSKNLEKVIWEIVPDMAEKLIVEEIEKLKKGE